MHLYIHFDFVKLKLIRCCNENAFNERSIIYYFHIDVKLENGMIFNFYSVIFNQMNLKYHLNWKWAKSLYLFLIINWKLNQQKSFTIFSVVLLLVLLFNMQIGFRKGVVLCNGFFSAFLIYMKYLLQTQTHKHTNICFSFVFFNIIY